MALRAELYDWYPAVYNTIGVLVVCHGISEHRGRYRLWAEWMADAGWSVLVVDLPGHGIAADSPGLPEGNRWADFRERLKAAVLTAGNHAPGEPVWLIGHSMGSIVALTTAAKKDWPEPLHGIVLLGTLLPGRAEARLMRGIAGFGPDDRTHPLLEALVFGKYQRHFSRDMAGADWISDRAACREDYARDPLCGARPSRRLWRMLGEGLCELTAPNGLKNLPEGTEILILAGGEDPVGQFGKGPKKMASRLRRHGLSNTLKLYPSARHELLQNGSDLTVWIDLERMMKDFSK